MEIALIFTGALIFFSLIFNALFEKTRVPNVLFLLFVGLLIGPVFNLVSPEDLGRLGKIFTTITLIVILYESGTRLKFEGIGTAIGPASLLTIFNFLVPVAVGMAVGYFGLGLELLPSAFLGACVGSISTPIILPMLRQLKLGKKAENVVFLECALSDIVCLIGALALLDAMDSGSFSISDTIKHMAISLLFATSIGLAVGYFWTNIRRYVVTKLKNSMFTSFALAFMLYGFCELLGVNGGMAVLSFGFILGNINDLSDILEKRSSLGKDFIKRKNPMLLMEDERNFYSEIAFIFKTFFFVYIGMSIRLSESEHIVMGILFISLMFIVRIPSIALFCRKGYSPRDRRIMSILNPKGLVSAVLASMPLQLAVTEQEIRTGEVIQNIGYASVMFSIIIFSLLIFLVEKFDKKDNSDRTQNEGNLQS
ncbi:NhaP-type Na+/H+ or K+/H+ antiporter [Dysgonomonas alginatilytica]|uniref:NhaP-type Na+/H+ or K+/H+ antiporter n=1 Tax=Dysgonomonas alginatilytica TaxID=1605892 RepID=A0A2V3PKA1_9BACT|nr:cation:proton antiporter [Dysgonomonas alginatilytica]PXV59357.1 NhaP-type Na+/H+ or K+/H+ antiporter [Dysgonomonas alginatilytica]